MDKAERTQVIKTLRYLMDQYGDGNVEQLCRAVYKERGNYKGRGGRPKGAKGKKREPGYNWDSSVIAEVTHLVRHQKFRDGSACVRDLKSVSTAITLALNKCKCPPSFKDAARNRIKRQLKEEKPWLWWMARTNVSVKATAQATSASIAAGVASASGRASAQAASVSGVESDLDKN